MKYAGLDAFAGVLLFRYAMEIMDPVLQIDPPNSADLLAGTAVRLCARTGTRCVAEGIVADHAKGET